MIASGMYSADIVRLEVIRQTMLRIQDTLQDFERHKEVEEREHKGLAQRQQDLNSNPDDLPAEPEPERGPNEYTAEEYDDYNQVSHSLP
jgi:hypothetical protein